VSTLALLRDWNEANARAAQREADRRAALTQRQRDREDFLDKVSKWSFWTMVALIPVMGLLFAVLGFVVAVTWVIHHI
jgi:uncharacterized BrkB/YihY/UPF0761 family membrane protein